MMMTAFLLCIYVALIVPRNPLFVSFVLAVKGTNFSEDMVVVIIFICTFVPKFTNEGYGSEENTEISAPGDG